VLGRLRSLPWGVITAALTGIALAAALRYTLVDFKSVDYYSSLKPWYGAIRSQGFAAFATAFSNYNPPYLYLLYVVVRSFPNASAVVAAKLPAMLADLVCASIVFLIVRSQHPRQTTLALVAGMVVLFAPTVVLNSSFWGQADSLYTAGILAWTYLMMTRRPVWAVVWFGVALAFKLQAVFVAPVLVALALKGAIPWKALLIIPGILVLALVPAWAAGRPLQELASIYASQASQYESITMNAPSAYAWLPGSKQVFNMFYAPGLIAGAAAAVLWCFVIYKSPRALSAHLIVEVSLAAALIIPFFLPKMHERYFYSADVLSIAFAFLYPEFFYVALLAIGTSFLSYQQFLFERDLVPLPVLTLALLALIGLLVYHAMRQLYVAPQEEEQHLSGRDPSAAAAEGLAAGDGR
jgi:Gpi18-like mannosyltransferase